MISIRKFYLSGNVNKKIMRSAMKKTFLLFFLILFFTANTATAENLSGSTGRDLTTPADRLVGHWTNELNEHYYYGRLKDGLGSYIIVTPVGKTLFHQYSMLSQEPAGEKIVVQLLLKNGDNREETYFISPDGQQLKKISTFRGMEVVTFRQYMDDKVKP